ncbi:MAG TPA: DUF479 domain-containing protein [Bacteroidales bacterium]|nr:MAG: hypothetical protein A2W98_10400 [Bacteroidetes bacterium GWF2_33_38]OFY71956.1 MAG: hypothetical protein A2265_02310 [Bacteroidetes bacterium RIFOXYA12_FULL_33_9]HBF87904.1 DUF479 domain-containing protein [Bacteroidales bacterium]
MNYLAHIYLSGNDNDVKLGNFIGDAVKGNKFENFDFGIKKGIILHRNIDFFTDNHHIHKQSRDRIRHLYHKHSGIVIDIFYDHFLAKNWDKFSNENYHQFIHGFYFCLLTHYWSLPMKIKVVFPFLVLNNWLKQYATIDGIEDILARMSLRTSLPNFTEQAIFEFKNNYELFESDFLVFFPMLIEHVEYLKKQK